jgi:hypothetical protein
MGAKDCVDTSLSSSHLLFNGGGCRRCLPKQSATRAGAGQEIDRLAYCREPSALTAIIAPVIGAFAGFFIFSFFATGMMQADFMPKITIPDSKHWIAQWGGILEMGPPCGPSGSIDDFKLLLAGLASGFSERLFPVMLNSLSNRLEPRSAPVLNK